MSFFASLHAFGVTLFLPVTADGSIHLCQSAGFAPLGLL